MTKALPKVKMARFMLKNIYLRSQNEENWVNYKISILIVSGKPNKNIFAISTLKI